MLLQDQLAALAAGDWAPFLAAECAKPYFAELDAFVSEAAATLPDDVQARAAAHVRIPVKDCIRSLNLSTSAGIILYMALAGLNALEAW